MDNLKPNILPLCLCLRQKHPLKNETRRCVEEGRQEGLDTYGMKIFISLIAYPIYKSSHTKLKESKSKLKKKKGQTSLLPCIGILFYFPFFVEDLG